MSLHSSHAAATVDTTGPRRAGQVLTRTESGGSLGSFADEWATPWNEADLDKSEVLSGNPHPKPHPLGRVTSAQKTYRTQNAITELVASWNDMSKTNRVTPNLSFNRTELTSARHILSPQSPSFR